MKKQTEYQIAKRTLKWVSMDAKSEFLTKDLIMKTYKSCLSVLFNNRQGAEDIFRRQSKQHYPATELAYIIRYLDGESELNGLFSIENLELVKTLRK